MRNQSKRQKTKMRKLKYRKTVKQMYMGGSKKPTKKEIDRLLVSAAEIGYDPRLTAEQKVEALAKLSVDANEFAKKYADHTKGFGDR